VALDTCTKPRDPFHFKKCYSGGWRAIAKVRSIAGRLLFVVLLILC
jgi:hypothetical protein